MTKKAPVRDSEVATKTDIGELTLVKWMVGFNRDLGSVVVEGVRAVKPPMTVMVTEIYDALKKVGVDEDLARAAAKAVLGAEEKEQLATKAELRAELAELKAELIKWNVGAMMALSAIFAAIVKLT